MAPASPRYVRFAQALALVSGVAIPGCYEHHTIARDAGPTDAPPVADAGADADPCATCECVFGGDRPPPPGSCEEIHAYWCCGVIGPLAPPDLAA